MGYYFDGARLSALVLKKRSNQTYKSVAEQIGISLSTLHRTELGRIPQWEVFLKICDWLNADPRMFIVSSDGPDEPVSNCDRIIDILKSEPTFSPQLTHFLFLMIQTAYETYVESSSYPEDVEISLSPKRNDLKPTIRA